jgi:predicted nucleic acid-binding protein
VSAQTLAEFSAVALRKLDPPLPVKDIADAVLGFRAVFDVLPITASVVLEALRGVRDHHLAYFDAQIWAAARLAQCELVLSEDFADGATVDGVTFVNPFSGPEVV